MNREAHDATDRALEVRTAPYPLSWRARIALLVRVWSAAVRIHLRLRRSTVAEVVQALDVPGTQRKVPIALLNRGVSRGLRVGRRQPRCLLRSLVLFHLLRQQQDLPELVIGLKDGAVSSDAHAWVELAGVDVGPLPGSRGYVAMARYPRSRST